MPPTTTRCGVICVSCLSTPGSTPGAPAQLVPAPVLLAPISPGVLPSNPPRPWYVNSPTTTGTDADLENYIVAVVAPIRLPPTGVLPPNLSRLYCVASAAIAADLIVVVVVAAGAAAATAEDLAGA